MAMVGAYMTMIRAEICCNGCCVNIFSALIVANIINPYDLDEQEDFNANRRKRNEFHSSK